MLELSILGPAFELPSIDAECIAAVSLLTLRFGKDTSKWTTTIAHSATQTLPLLVDGELRISGFSNICHHLRLSSKTRPSADGIALTSLIQSRAPALVSAYLYLSYENYSTTTRPAFTPILPLYARFIVPGVLRAAAKERTAQLGISNLDVDALDDKRSSAQSTSSSESAFDTTSQDRSSLLLPKPKTIRSLLAQKPESMAAFKLRGLADALLEPLQTMLGQSDFLSGRSEPGAVDCLAFAYLSLMLKPAVPQAWLRSIIKEHYIALEQYVEKVDAALALGGLPEYERAPVTVTGVASSIAAACQDQLTLLQPLSVTRQSTQPVSVWSQYLASMLIITGSTVLAAASWASLPVLTARHGEPIQIFGRGPRPVISHVSAALSGLDFMSSIQEPSQPHVSNDDDLPARVGIEIEP